MVFAKSDQELGCLVTRPLTDFHNVKQILRKHQDYQYHKDACKCMVEFQMRMENKRLPVYQEAQSAVAKRVWQNREKLRSIIKTIVWLGKQNVPLRGHRDDSSWLDIPDHNPGNLQALLNFRVEAGDEILREHFQTAKKNATYRSKTIQNELIELIGHWIRRQLVEEVKEAKFFSILADEVTDVSNKEQLSVLLRFLDREGEVREEFLHFVSCDQGVDGEAIAGYILSSLRGCGLDCNNLRGQGYDGAGAMAGAVKGVKSRIQAEFPLALYTHCASHKLNLAIVAACEIQAVRNAMAVIGKVSRFFMNSPKRQGALEAKIKLTDQPNRRKKVIDLCRTRWVARHDALDNFSQLYAVVIDVFEGIRLGPRGSWNSDTISDAASLLRSVTTFEFLMAFTVMYKVMAVVRGLSVSLQSTALDITKAYGYVSETVENLEDLRMNVVVNNTTWFEEAQKMSEGVGAECPSIPRRCGTQRNRDNHPADSAEEYFRRTITIPFLDHLISHLRSVTTTEQHG